MPTRRWYFIEWLKEIKQRTLKANLRHLELISITCLEFVIVIISYNAILDSIKLLGKLLGKTHPKILILANITTIDS